MTFANLSKLDKYYLSRYMYSIGEPIISDHEYDELETEVLTQYGALAYSSYDDDEIPEELIRSVYSEEYSEELIARGKPKEAIPDLTVQVSKSMQSFRTLKECYSWVVQHQNLEIMISPKIDGINTATNFKLMGNSNYTLNYSRSRGRSGRAFDITDNMRKVLPNTFNTTNTNCSNDIVFACEAILPRNQLDFLNNSIERVTGTNPNIHTPRGGAMSLLKRQDVPEDVYEKLKVFVFRCSYGRTFGESLKFASENGFNVVPYEIYKFKFKTYSEYEEELTELIYKYKNLSESMGITTDGIVLQVNDRKLAENEHTQTIADGDNLAVKAVAWEASVFTSRVIDIVIKPSANQYCCKVKVEPVYTESGKKLSMVNLYNADTLISNKVKVGSTIEFKYENETTISFLRNITKEV